MPHRYDVVYRNADGTKDVAFVMEAENDLSVLRALFESLGADKVDMTVVLQKIPHWARVILVYRAAGRRQVANIAVRP